MRRVEAERKKMEDELPTVGPAGALTDAPRGLCTGVGKEEGEEGEAIVFFFGRLRRPYVASLLL